MLNKVMIKKFVKDKMPRAVQFIRGCLELKYKLLAKVWPEKSIVFFTGSTFDEWSPASLTEGIGGSETAVIYLAKLWSKMGYRVTVYGNHGKRSGVYDGVKYCHHTKFNKYDTFDTLIFWKYWPVNFYVNFPYKANRV